jgi:outer membrane immunogenic protein
MNKITACVTAIGVLIVAPALAASPSPPPPPAPVYNWTGWYVGVNVGASFGNAKTDFNAGNIVIQAGPGSDFFSTAFAGSDTVYPTGFMGGGQIGHNWQFSPLWVVGLEADFQGALEKDSNTLTDNFSGSINTPNFAAIAMGSTVLDYQTKIDWFGTMRGRIGYVWGNGEVMSYVTGGLAYGEVKIDGTNTVSGRCTPCGVFLPALTFSVSQPFSRSQVNTGWVVGYGTEGRLAIPGWTYKVEGLWMDLGTLDATGVSINPPFAVSGGQVTTHTHFTDGILRAGLNYQFH